MKKITKVDILKTADLIIEGPSLQGIRSIDMPNIEANVVTGILDTTVSSRMQTLVTSNATSEVPYTSSKLSVDILGHTDIHEETIVCDPLEVMRENDAVKYKIPFKTPIDLNDKIVIGTIDIANKEFYSKEYAQVSENGLDLRNKNPNFVSPSKIVLLYAKINSSKEMFKKFEKNATLTIESDGTYRIDSEFVLLYDSLTDKYFDRYGHYESIPQFSTSKTVSQSLVWKSFKKRPYDVANGTTLSSTTGNYTEIKYPSTTIGTDSLAAIPPVDSELLYNADMARIMNQNVGNTNSYTATARITRYQEINGVSDFTYDVITSVKHPYVYQDYKFSVIPHINMTYTSTKVSSVNILGFNISLSAGDVSIDSDNYINLKILDTPQGITYKKENISNNLNGSSAYTINTSAAQFYKSGVAMTNATGNTDYTVFDASYTKLKAALNTYFTNNKETYAMASARLSVENERVYANLVADINISMTLFGKDITKKYTIPCYLPRILSTIIG